FVALLIQSPEQMISNATCLNNITRYMEDVDNVLDNRLNIGIIMISLVNDKALTGMIGVVEYHKLLRCVSDTL
ncbi:EAL domain-containing protein, partial [Coprococcus eutactus]|nr:EAL domain-containing protein [Coprococcus eutactus]